MPTLVTPLVARRRITSCLALALTVSVTASSLGEDPQVGQSERAVGSTDPSVFDEAAPPGQNYDKAEFRLWLPGPEPVRATLVLVPGSNGDGRAMAVDPVWQEFARRNRLAIVACRFTDKPHDQAFLEDYVDAGRGSGQALVDVLSTLAARTRHPELAHAPLLLWGMSAGGQFNYEFAAWTPERVVAFVVNKGGIYYRALVPRAARETPALLFVGGQDLESRTQTIRGLFAVNRRAGALWALTEEPTAGHVVGRSRDLSLVFFEEVLAHRLHSDAGATAGVSGAPGPLRSLDPKAGYLGDLKARTVAPQGDTRVPAAPTAWLPSERTALAWRAVVSDQDVPARGTGRPAPASSRDPGRP